MIKKKTNATKKKVLQKVNILFKKIVLQKRKSLKKKFNRNFTKKKVLKKVLKKSTKKVNSLKKNKKSTQSKIFFTKVVEQLGVVA